MDAKSLLRFWSITTLCVLIVWVLCFGYDRLWGNDDGLVANLAYHNLFMLVLLLVGLGGALSTGLTVRNKLMQNLALSTLSGLVFIVLLEGVGHVVLGMKFSQNASFFFRRFYISPENVRVSALPVGDVHPVVGRWRLPNMAYQFVTCAGDSVAWSYNASGANDRQRFAQKPDSTKKRVAWIGDSFFEGYMVNNADRCSNLLEQKTGLEHLNFAISGAAPLNYYLIYHELVRSYETDVVIIGFLPANDFETYNDRQAYRLVEWPSYMPYWEGTYPNYTLRYSLANQRQSILSGDLTQPALLKTVDSVYASLPLSGKFKADLLAHSSVFRLLGEVGGKAYKEGQFTRYEQFSKNEWDYASYSLSQLIKEAKGKKVIVVSIPTLWDLKALKNGKQNRVDPQLAAFCRKEKIGFIPLVSSFLNYKGNPEQLFVSCDGHWSVQGEAFAAQLLLNHPVYRTSVGLLP